MPHGIFEPLVPEEALDPIQHYLNQRRQDQTPMEARIKGFGSGALEGLRSLTSPANLAGMIPGAGIGARLLKFAPKAARMAAPTLDILEDIPVQQVMPSMDDVGALIGSMKHNLAKVPAKGMRPQAPARPNFPEFAPTDTPTAPMRGLQAAGEDPLLAHQVTRYMRRMR